MPRVRGRVFVPVRAFIKERFGEAGWERVLARLAPQDRQIVDGFVLSEGWYDLPLYQRMFDAIRAEFAAEMPNLGYHIGQKSAEMNVPLFHRMLMRFGSPAGVFVRAAALWKEYFDQGRMEVIERGENHYRVLMYDEHARPWLAAEILPGWAAKVVEMTGHEVVASRLDTVHEGKPPGYEIYVEWR
ncbi:MAG TPA: hypothetical protein VKN99_12530 [Polyangia bacterium]|nr:hypothetical protein [Polyangia bacterium]